MQRNQPLFIVHKRKKKQSTAQKETNRLTALNLCDTINRYCGLMCTHTDAPNHMTKYSISLSALQVGDEE